MVIWYQVFLYNTNNLHTVVSFKVFLSKTNNYMVKICFNNSSNINDLIRIVFREFENWLEK